MRSRRRNNVNWCIRMMSMNQRNIEEMAPIIRGVTCPVPIAVLAAIALPPSLFTNHRISQNRNIHLIHHADDRLCVWTPSNQDLRMLQQNGFTFTSRWRAYLGTAQHNYPHWTKVNLPEGKQDMANLERIPGVLPFEVYAQAPLRLVSWCSFELPVAAKRLLRQLAVMCESPETTTQDLITQIASHRSIRKKMLRNT